MYQLLRRLTSVRPSPPAVAQSDPVRTRGRQLADAHVAVDVRERSQVAALPQTPVPRVVPRRELVAVEHVARVAVFEVVRGVLAAGRAHCRVQTTRQPPRASQVTTHRVK